MLELLNDGHMRALIGFKPNAFHEHRLHLNVLLVLDTGLRISEALQLHEADIDVDNLIVKVLGKGREGGQRGRLGRQTPAAVASSERVS